MMQLKTRNPQMANQVQGLINSKSNPMDFYRQITKNRTPEQMQEFYNFAKQWGISDETIQQLQNGNGIDTK